PETSTLRQRFGIPAQRHSICFGSTHEGDEEQILEALEPIWSKLDATIIIAPRHPKRVSSIEDLLRARNLDYEKVSEATSAARRIILVDTLGELCSFYAASSLVFIGGSLIKRGGHNLMEPAAFSKPMLTGPHTFNFRYEMMALNRSKAVQTVKNADELRQAIENWLANPGEYASMGNRARQVLDSMAGASSRTVASLKQLGLLPDA
ncbi:MAG: 3-deoxy-D-manno-octulosonic acid transferase, partial [Candidatus Riflebacteria bacterium]|nr:3-deoxy-D-manno-octulosonic acid transferase [Candidatus Riflebacteria bacterium]